MVKYQLFNLEKIREITSPIGELQGKLTNLKEKFELFDENKNRYSQYFTEEKINEIQDINIGLTNIYRDLVEKTILNTKNSLIFQDHLISKYKHSFKEDLKSSELNQSDIVYEIGLSLIKEKVISKAIEKISFVFALNSNQWMSLFKSLKHNSLFLSILHKSAKFLEIEKLKLAEKIKKKKEEKENSKQLLDKGPSPKLDKYQEYFKYSKEQIQRRRRREKRKSLETLEENPDIKIEVTKDITEKIEEFKSKLKSDFKEKYLIQRDDQQDPVTLIRELRKKREEKYQEHLKKFKNKKKV